MKKKILSEAEKKQRSRYQVNLKFDREEDKDIIEWLDRVDKKQTFIKNCVRYFDKMYKMCDNKV